MGGNPLVLERICVYCGSSRGTAEVYTEQAAAFGRTLAARGIGLVYGGARVGVMGALADATLAAGGEVFGVIPEHLLAVEVGHTGLTERYVVPNMHERKAKMAELADGFVALPGGVGTLEELFEVWTWAQLGLHEKPLGLFDVAGYYRPLAEFAEHMVDEGFVRTEQYRMLVLDQDPDRLLNRFGAYDARTTCSSAG